MVLSIFFSFDPWNFDDKEFHWLAAGNSNNNKNNNNLSSSLSHYSNNNICFYRRWIIVCTIFFFFSFQLQLEELGSSRLSFFKSIKIIIILPYLTLTIIMIRPSALHFIISWLTSIISSSISKIIPPSILLFLFFHFIVAILLFLILSTSINLSHPPFPSN